MHKFNEKELEAHSSTNPPEELCEIFYTNQKKGHVFRVKLSNNGITLRKESPSLNTKEQWVKICDIIGGRCMRQQKRSRRLGSCACSSPSTRSNGDVNNKDAACHEEDGSAYLYVFAYILKKNLRSNLRRERTVLTLRFRSFDTFEDNMREADRWYKALRWHKNQTLDTDILTSIDGRRRRRLLIMINPKSGSGKARELFHQKVAVVLNEAELAYDLHVTKHANYARDFVRLRNISIWCGIVAIGGDGLFFEILNGLLQRGDWEEMMKDISLGIIPCGSGNGLARSISHFYNEPYDPNPILGAALTVVSGKSAPMDVVRIELQNQVLYSFLSVGWGLISDIDIESERLRALGYQRFTLWTLHRLISLRTYRGKISYLVKSDSIAPENADDEQKPSIVLKHSKSCNTYLNKPEYDTFQSSECIGGDSSEFNDVISLETSVNQSFRSRCDSWLSIGSRKSTYYSISDSIYHSIAGDSEYEESQINNANEITQPVGPGNTAPSLHEPLPESWIVEEGEFIMAHAAYQTHLGVDCFFAPSSKLNDGTIYLVIIRSGISRSQLLNFMINLSSGTHLPTKNNRNEFVKVVAVTAFRIEPKDAQGILTVDGERVEFGPLQAKMLAGIARVMVP